MNTNFYSFWFDLTKIEPEATASIADALSTRLSMLATSTTSCLNKNLWHLNVDFFELKTFIFINLF